MFILKYYIHHYKQCPPSQLSPVTDGFLKSKMACVYGVYLIFLKKEPECPLFSSAEVGSFQRHATV